ncbi:peptidoglycan-binding domain-containing protein [Saccharothrix isguenensis]
MSVVQHLMNQRGHGLVVDGQVGPATWPELVHPLSQGAGGHHVRGFQVALNKRSAGLRVDGTYGSVTTTAVRSSQSANRLVVDGNAGPVTWRALVG